MSLDKTGGPAFPSEYQGGCLMRGSPGMTLRDYFAAKMLASLIRDERYSDTDAARVAYAYADAMIAERAKQKP